MIGPPAAAAVPALEEVLASPDTHSSLQEVLRDALALIRGGSGPP
jgi:hypothetical protein